MYSENSQNSGTTIDTLKNMGKRDLLEELKLTHGDYPLVWLTNALNNSDGDIEKAKVREETNLSHSYLELALRKCPPPHSRASQQIRRRER